MVREIWLSKKKNNDNNNTEEEESSDLPACRISETVSSLVLKLGLHIVVGSSRLDNHYVEPNYEVTDQAKSRCIPSHKEQC